MENSTLLDVYGMWGKEIVEVWERELEVVIARGKEQKCKYQWEFKKGKTRKFRNSHHQVD